MRCPRCDSPLDDAAVRCPACRAPLQLADEPSPSRLDLALDLDRRRSRTPVPAVTAPPPPAVALRDGPRDLGDLSFDPPADDGPWTLTAPPAEVAEPARDDPDERWEDEAAALAPVDGERGIGADIADDVADAAALAAQDDADGSRDDDPDDLADDARDDVGDDEPERVEAAAPIDDPGAARRGKLLSLASIAVASAAALLAVLSGR